MFAVEVFERQRRDGSSWAAADAAETSSGFYSDADGTFPLPAINGSKHGPGGPQNCALPLKSGWVWATAEDASDYAVDVGARVVNADGWAAAIRDDDTYGDDGFQYAYTWDDGDWSPQEVPNTLLVGGSAVRRRRWLRAVRPTRQLSAFLERWCGMYVPDAATAEGRAEAASSAVSEVVTSLVQPDEGAADDGASSVQGSVASSQSSSGGSSGAAQSTTSSRALAARAARPAFPGSPHPRAPGLQVRSANGGINALELPHVKLHSSRHLLLMTHGVGAPTDESFSAKVSGMRCLLRALSAGGYGGVTAAAEAAGPSRGLDFAYVLWSSRSARMAQVTAWLSRLHVPLHPVIRETARKTLLQAALYLGGYREDIAATLQAEFNAAYTSYLATHPLFAERDAAIDSLMHCDCRMSERAGWGAGPAGGITTGDGAARSCRASQDGAGSGHRHHHDGASVEDAHDADADDDDDGRTCPAHARPSHTSLWCHSLGGVMALDLLVARPYSLVFTPMHLFTLGSPMGLYLSLRGLSIEELHDYLPRLYLGPADPGDSRHDDDHRHGDHHDESGEAAHAHAHPEEGLRALADVHLHYDYRCHYFNDKEDRAGVADDADSAGGPSDATSGAITPASTGAGAHECDKHNLSLSLPAGRAARARARALLRPFPATQLHNLFDVQDAVAYLVAPLLWPTNTAAADASGAGAASAAGGKALLTHVAGSSAVPSFSSSPVPLPRTVPTVTGEDARREFASLQVQIDSLAGQLQEQRAIASGASTGCSSGMNSGEAGASGAGSAADAAAAAAAALAASAGSSKPIPAGIAAAVAEGLSSVETLGAAPVPSSPAQVTGGAAAMPLQAGRATSPAAASAASSSAQKATGDSNSVIASSSPALAVAPAVVPALPASKPVRLGVGPAVPLQWNSAVASAPAAGAPISATTARRTASGSVSGSLSRSGASSAAAAAGGGGGASSSSAAAAAAAAASAAARASDPLAALYHAHGLDLPLPVDPALLGEQNPFISIAAATAGMGFGAVPRDDDDAVASGGSGDVGARATTGGAPSAARSGTSGAGDAAAASAGAPAGSSATGTAPASPGAGSGSGRGADGSGGDFVQALERMRDAADAQVGRLGLDRIAQAAAAVTHGGRKGTAGSSSSGSGTGGGAASAGGAGAAGGGSNTGGAVSALWGGGGGGGGLDLNSGLSTLAAMGEYLNAAAAHRSYWEHPDVLGYVLLQIARRERDVLAARLARARTAAERARVRRAAADAANAAAAAKAVASAAAAVATAVRSSAPGPADAAVSDVGSAAAGAAASPADSAGIKTTADVTA